MTTPHSRTTREDNIAPTTSTIYNRSSRHQRRLKSASSGQPQRFMSRRITTTSFVFILFTASSIIYTGVIASCYYPFLRPPCPCQCS
ncbi:hypothetical protein BU26DRAFT_234669 [Trematosphaeria pertusa]|uniref:Uncharacterized protein n=1 Tax=Trematosphaeria pertusa TaxID=390896 RepID=A0A6A6IUF9_9PLEO|nr:uncharacterized protein BU26DRAFT_234669 [Trematosphaeria pertusa]KAF2254056.1 hypothetical protein BU26DRAFT_234669 [Trematosphaeria pertusa]